jgi:hypothetical protein
VYKCIILDLGSALRGKRCVNQLSSVPVNCSCIMFRGDAIDPRLL